MQYYKVTGSNDVPLGKDRTFGKGLSGMETENPIMNNDGESTLPEGILNKNF